MAFPSPINCIALCALLSAGPASAALGSTVAGAATTTTGAPLTSPAAQARVLPHATAAAAYTMRELTTPAGTVIRQFAAGDGRVFAVSWSGPTKPDLRELLGTYFDDFSAPRDGTPRGHAQHRLENADLVVQSGGRMRAFSGRAYLPSKLPAGVLINDLR